MIAGILGFWEDVRGRVVPITIEITGPRRASHTSDDSEDAELERPSRSASGLSGFGCMIDYMDARGRASRRRISIIRLEQAGQQRYLRAHCHERGSARLFKLERIAAFFDVETGEVFDASNLIDAEADFVTSSPVGWGISPIQRADVIAGLNALVFMGRCDRDWHPLEIEVLERFVESYWWRAELAGDPPMADIIAHAKRLRPDAESFFGSLIRASTKPALANAIRNFLTEVVDADGTVTDEEFFYASKVNAYLSGEID